MDIQFAPNVMQYKLNDANKEPTKNSYFRVTFMVFMYWTISNDWPSNIVINYILLKTQILYLYHIYHISYM